jgi:dolichol kinase
VAVAFMGALFIFIWVETIRVIKLKPFANAIDSFMKEYVDSRDQGKLILTHIYLLSGCAFPLWLFFPHEDYTVREIVIWSSGIVSLGIGDTMVYTFLCFKHFNLIYS